MTTVGFVSSACSSSFTPRAVYNPCHRVGWRVSSSARPARRRRPCSTVTPSLNSESPSDTPAQCEQLVRQLWHCFNSGSFSNATALFAADAVYHDTLYSKPFEGRSQINYHLVAMESAFEAGLVYVVDDLAASSTSAGCRWHVELENGTPLPFSRGASTYKVGREGGKLVLLEAWDFPEPSIKAASILLPVLSVAVKLLRRFPGLLPPSDTK